MRRIPYNAKSIFFVSLLDLEDRLSISAGRVFWVAFVDPWGQRTNRAKKNGERPIEPSSAGFQLDFFRCLLFIHIDSVLKSIFLPLLHQSHVFTKIVVAFFLYIPSNLAWFTFFSVSFIFLRLCRCGVVWFHFCVHYHHCHRLIIIIVIIFNMFLFKPSPRLTSVFTGRSRRFVIFVRDVFNWLEPRGWSWARVCNSNAPRLAKLSCIPLPRISRDKLGYFFNFPIEFNAFCIGF